MSLSFTGTFDELKEKLSSLESEWNESEANKKVLRRDGGILSFYLSTGRIQFQGREDAKKRLEELVSSILYPSEYNTPESIVEEIPEVNAVDKDISESSIETMYLEGSYTEAELVIGLVNAVGTESRRVVDSLKNRLTHSFNYNVEEIRVSDLLDSANIGDGEYNRIKGLMKKGDELRKKTEDNSILAAGAIQKIQELRDSSKPNTAFIINSLKHPDEVALLRQVYSYGFFLVGVHSDVKRRTDYLTCEKGLTQKNASELIQIDEDEAISYGQRTRDTYHLSDFYINLGKNDDQVKNTLQRFLDLLFSHPYKSPTFDEFAMFMAFNSSIRSSDLSRQVGAVITQNKQIVATGANDIPRFGGGQYWAELDSGTGEVTDVQGGKDYTHEYDSNKAEQASIISNILSNAINEGLITEGDKSQEESLKKALKGSRISDLTEFGRVVHAEMDALLSCSREGIKTIDGTLYCTTFPCHNCAKHIISSGIKRVVYVEPYPKSKALEFHADSIILKTHPEADIPPNMVIFEPFTGIGARRFLDLFSMNLGAGKKLKRKDKEGHILDWSMENASLRVPLIAKSYVEIEKAAIKKFEDAKKS